MKRTISSVIAILLTSVVAAVAFAPAAHAGPLDLTCAASTVAQYNPPLTNYPQTVTLTSTGLYVACTSLSHPEVISGSRTAVSTSTRSCVDALAPNAVTYTITWNTGQTSTLQLNVTYNRVGAVVTVVSVGIVTAGLFAGDTVVSNLEGVSLELATCLLGLGTVSSISNEGVLEITSA